MFDKTEYTLEYRQTIRLFCNGNGISKRYLKNKNGKKLQQKTIFNYEVKEL